MPHLFQRIRFFSLAIAFYLVSLSAPQAPCYTNHVSAFTKFSADSNTLEVHQQNKKDIATNFYEVDQKLCETILQKLWKTVSHGVTGTPPKLIHIGDVPSYNKNTISMPNSFITWLKETFKENFEKALTLSIAHELQHHLQAIGGNCWIDWQLKLTSDNTQEAEADYKGIILTYLVGFNDIAVFFEDFMKSIYDRYNVPSKSNGYPHLEERKRYAEQVVQRAKQDWIHFEVANWCLAIGEYEIARKLYDVIPFKSKLPEMQNNYALSYILEAQNKYKIDSLYYPFQLVDTSGLQNFRTVSSIQAKALCEKAQKEILQIREKFPNFQPAMLNLLCLYSLKGKPDSTLLLWERLPNAVKQQDQFKLVKALAQYKQATTKQQGKIALENLQKSNSLAVRMFANINLIKKPIISNTSTLDCMRNNLRPSESPKSKLEASSIKYEDYGLKKYYCIILSSLGISERKRIEFLTSFSATKNNMYHYPTLYTGNGNLIWDKTTCAIYDNQDNTNTRKIDYNINKF